MSDQSKVVDDLIVFWRAKTHETVGPLQELARHNPELAAILHEYENDFVFACVTGSAQDIEERGAALCRKYLQAVDELQEKTEQINDQTQNWQDEHGT